MRGYTEIEDIVKRWGIRMRATRLRNLILLVYGILHSHSGNLSAIVRHWPNGVRRHIHRLKRLHRFLKNPGVQVAAYFAVLAAVIWPYRPGGGRTSLYPVVLDWTQVHDWHVLFAAVPRKKRALPLAYEVYHPQRLRKSQNQLERGMLTLVTSLLPRSARLVVLADAGFGQTELIRWLQEHGIDYVIRLRAETLVHYRGKSLPLGSLDTLEGAPILFSQVDYRDEKPVRLNLVVSRKGDKIWYLGTSFTDAEQAVGWYIKRFWIEEMFRDLKSRLGLTHAHLKHEERLARLLLGFQIAYLILALIGLHLPKRWQAYLASRNRLSFFQLGLWALDWLILPGHLKVWQRSVFPALFLQSG
jgi:Transposase DDE domain